MPTSSKAVASLPIYRGPLPHITTVERLPVTVYDQPGDASRAVAREIADLVTQRAAAGKQTVLGLATGSTPVGVYDELIRLHREEGVTFKTVVTFNLDEYWPMPTDALQSYHRFMREHLFDHLDIPRESIHIPDGTLARENILAACAAYEEKIREAGGIDLQVLGIGRTGHIGFNEPGSTIESRTRLITLDSVTRSDAASDFFGEWNVPRQAITMGVGSILAARRVVLLAFGEHKAPIVRKAVEEAPCSHVSASALQQHADARFVLDRAAAEFDLTRDDNRREFLKRMLGVAARIPDPAVRDQFADRLAHKARVTEDVVRAEIRKAAANRKTELSAERVPSLQGNVRKAEKGLIWSLVHDPVTTIQWLNQLEPEDLKGLSTANILRTAQELTVRPEDVPGALMERLTTQEAELLASVAAEPFAPAVLPDLCVVALKYVRLERELADVQRELKRLQDMGDSGPASMVLLARKSQMVRALEAMKPPKELQ